VFDENACCHWDYDPKTDQDLWVLLHAALDVVMSEALRAPRRSGEEKATCFSPQWKPKEEQIHE
jgi:hypothetical protein